MAQTHDVTCALSSVQLQGGKPSVKLQTHGLNESAEAKRDSMHLASFSTKFTFMINSLHIACVTWPFLLSLAFAIVCVLLQFYSKGHLIQVSPSRHNCEQRWKRWGGVVLGMERKQEWTWLGPKLSFPLYNPSYPSTDTQAWGSCPSLGGISQLRCSRTLCYTESLQNNSNPSQSDFFFHLCLTVHYCTVP